MGSVHRRWVARSATAVRIVWSLDISPAGSMTWGIWEVALTELERFVQGYPKWDFTFSVELKNDGQRTVIGTGSLGPSPWENEVM